MTPSRLSLLESIRSWRLVPGLSFVIASAILILPLIQITQVISQCLYTCQRHMILIMSRFSCVVPNCTKQSQSDFELIQTIRSIGLLSICSIVDLITIAESNPKLIVYSSDASTLQVTLLHLTKDQWIILALLFLSATATTWPIWEDKSWLFAKDKSVKTTTQRESRSRGTKRSLWSLLSSCYCSCLFRQLTCSRVRVLVTQAAKEQAKAFSGQETVAMYTLCVHWLIYLSGLLSSSMCVICFG